jgi:uncharacterized delta-60 repeat protein
MKKQISFLIICFLSQFAFAQPGTIDHTFNPGDIGYGNGDGPNRHVFAMAEQTDAKILIGGDFITYNGTPRKRIARIHPDGTLDHSFDPGAGIDGSLLEVVVLESGKILVGGLFHQFNGQAVKNFVQLNPDGSLDEGFDTGTGPDERIWAIRQLSDGMILIGGSFSTYNDINVNSIARLHPDGSLDSTFQGPDNISSVSEIRLLADGKLLIGGHFGNYGDTVNLFLKRLLADGSADPDFNTNFQQGILWGGDGLYVNAIHVTDDNKYLVTGRLLSPDYGGMGCVFLLNDDGTLDEDFEIPEMTPISWYPSVDLIFPISQDKYLISGSFSSVNGVEYTGAAVLNSDGTLDLSFDTGDIGGLYSAIHRVDNQLIISLVDPSLLNQHYHLIRVNEDFIIDPTFNSVTGANHQVNTIAVNDDGKIYIGGVFHFYNGALRNAIARLLPDGSVDLGFDPGQGLDKNLNIFSIAPIQNSKVLVGGVFQGFGGFPVQNLVCLNSDGSVDTAFLSGTGPNGTVHHLAEDGNGKIIVAGDFLSFNEQPLRRIARLSPDGSLDETFNPGHGANQSIRSVAIQNDGKIIIGGNFTMFDSIPISKIARLNNDGSLDMDFNSGNGMPGGMVLSVEIQENGKIIVGGGFLQFAGIPSNRILRLNQNGSLDTTFNTGYGFNSHVDALAIQPDGKIILAGNFTMFDSIPANRIVRLNEDGSIDTTFMTGTGANGRIRDVAIHEHERIIIAGDFTAYDGTGRNRIARIMGDEPDGVRNDFRLAALKVYPNPAQDFIYLETDRFLQGAMIRLYDLQGRVVAENLDSNGQTFRFDIAKHEPGVYIIEIRTSEFIGRQKVIRY